MGCNTLIQNGAKLVTCSADILEEFGDRIIVDKRVMQEKVQQLSLESAIIPAKKLVDKYGNYSDTQKLIIVACKQPLSFDDIIKATQLPYESVQSELFNLQLDGVIEQDFTGRWQALHP